MADPIATPDDMAAVLGSTVDNYRAITLLGLAQDLCSAIIDPLPVTARAVVIGVAARAYNNPTNAQQQTAGPYSVNFGSAGGGLYLTKQDRATLLRLAGRGGAFSIDPTPADAGRGLPWWDQNITRPVGYDGGYYDSYYDGTSAMAYNPSTADPTRISGSVVPITASGAVTIGRENEVSGSAAVALTIPTTSVNGAMFGVKVLESYSGSGVTLAGTFAGGSSSFVFSVGQENKFQWDGSAWLIM